MSGFQLAQLNIALPREPLDAPLLAEFVAALDPVNASADAAEGFVWRLQTEDGDATAVRGFDDDRLIVNMSVWESLEALRDVRLLEPPAPRRDAPPPRVVRAHRRDAPRAVVGAGGPPCRPWPRPRSGSTLLRALGPSPDAFSFRRHFPPPSSTDVGAGRRRARALPGGLADSQQAPLEALPGARHDRHPARVAGEGAGGRRGRRAGAAEAATRASSRARARSG